MVVRQRIVGMVFDDELMAPDGFRVVFHPKEIVGQGIANLLVGRTAFGAGARAHRRLEYQRDQCNQANAQTPKAQQLLNSPRPAIPARGNQMLAGIFAAKKRAACFATLRAEKRRRASHREPDQSRLRATDRSPEAKQTPPPDPEWIELPQAIRNRATALRSRPVELSLKLLRIRRRSHRRR